LRVPQHPAVQVAARQSFAGAGQSAGEPQVGHVGAPPVPPVPVVVEVDVDVDVVLPPLPEPLVVVVEVVPSPPAAPASLLAHSAGGAVHAPASSVASTRTRQPWIACFMEILARSLTQ
jgi:hypothetical protein